MALNVSVFCCKTYILYFELFLLSFSGPSLADSPLCWNAVLSEYSSRAIVLYGFKLCYNFYIPVRCFLFSEQHVVGDSCFSNLLQPLCPTERAAIPVSHPFFIYLFLFKCKPLHLSLLNSILSFVFPDYFFNVKDLLEF